MNDDIKVYKPTDGPEKPSSLSMSEKDMIVQYIRDHPRLTAKELSKALGLRRSLVEWFLLDLERRGYVMTTKEDGAAARYIISGRAP